MTLWGSSVQRALDGITGEAGLSANLWVPGFSPRRLGSNALIDVQSDARGNAPQLGGGQHNDRPIGPFSVTLSPVTQANGLPLGGATAVASTAWRKLVARLKIGRGGLTSEAWVDWPFQGGTFTVACDTLSVNAMALDPDPALPTEPTSWDVRCGAWATPISDGRGIAPPRYTMKLPTPIAAGGGTSGEMMIPPFARAVQLQLNNRLDVNMLYDVLFRRYGAGVAQATYAGTLGGVVLRNWDYRPFDLPTEATTVVVNNNSGGAVTLVDGRLAYDLDLS